MSDRITTDAQKTYRQALRDLPANQTPSDMKLSNISWPEGLVNYEYIKSRIRGVSASSDAITVANDGTCTANITNNLSNRNKIRNGAMQVSQRQDHSLVL